MKLVLVPGWHEAGGALRVLIDGRHGIPGFTQRGFDCAVFGDGHGSLRERIEQFAAFVDDLKAREPAAFPISTFGYSAGGMIVRGYLRAHPERADDVLATFQLGTPNCGIVTDELALIMHAIGISRNVIEDLDFASDFMAWINGTTGHWEDVSGSKHKRWRLDGEPWVAPAGAAILNLVGRMPRHAPSGDGVVFDDSATIEGRMPHRIIDDPHANHLNLSGLWNLLTLVTRRWGSDDRLWPQVVEAATAFYRTQGTG